MRYLQALRRFFEAREKLPSHRHSKIPEERKEFHMRWKVVSWLSRETE
ncbi:hypothetical protein MM213_15345 [Belliella sp. R4-6]|uniref:Uncharacterized protein n=1 Tax=Belliella alkalica TaxID=1730871 RepID=A0ABS9VEJ5_9BACT|nr:hypothetical protein [Belliella alkalica]MCH7414874.1 hypothetical protein [Belliella alkalica]